MPNSSCANPLLPIKTGSEINWGQEGAKGCREICEGAYPWGTHKRTLVNLLLSLLTPSHPLRHRKHNPVQTCRGTTQHPLPALWATACRVNRNAPGQRWQGPTPRRQQNMTHPPQSCERPLTGRMDGAHCIPWGGPLTNERSGTTVSRHQQQHNSIRHTTHPAPRATFHGSREEQRRRPGGQHNDSGWIEKTTGGDGMQGTAPSGTTGGL
jgi:hypothetical protein